MPRGPSTSLPLLVWLPRHRAWRLPYCTEDGGVGVKRLPEAIQAILSRCRGTIGCGILEVDIPEVLVRLGRAAAPLVGSVTNQGRPLNRGQLPILRASGARSRASEGYQARGVRMRSYIPELPGQAAC